MNYHTLKAYLKTICDSPYSNIKGVNFITGDVVGSRKGVEISLGEYLGAHLIGVTFPNDHDNSKSFHAVDRLIIADYIDKIVREKQHVHND